MIALIPISTVFSVGSGVAVGSGVGSSVGSGVGVAVGSGEGVAVGSGVGEAVGSGFVSAFRFSSRESLFLSLPAEVDSRIKLFIWDTLLW